MMTETPVLQQQQH